MKLTKAERAAKRKEYTDYLQSEKWAKIRRKVFRHYGGEHRCCCCGIKQPIIDIHHMTYDRIFDEKLEDLRPLCRVCHSNYHNKSLSLSELSVINKSFSLQLNGRGLYPIYKHKPSKKVKPKGKIKKCHTKSKNSKRRRNKKNRFDDRGSQGIWYPDRKKQAITST